METYKFSKTERLKKNSEILKVLRGGNKLRGTLLSLYYKERPPLSSLTQSTGRSKSALPQNSRLGIVVSKRVLKKAHERNRIKRLVREVFRLHKHGLNKPFDLMVRLNKPLVSPSLNEIQKELISLLKKARVL